MALSRKAVRFIVAAIIVALTGLVVLQVSLLYDTRSQKEQTFRRNVMNALNVVASKLESRETAYMAVDVVGNTPGEISITGSFDTHDSARILHQRGTSMLDPLMPDIWMDSDAVMINLPTPQKVLMQIRDSLGNVDTTLVDSVGVQGEFRVEVASERLSRDNCVVMVITDSTEYELEARETPRTLIQRWSVDNTRIIDEDREFMFPVDDTSRFDLVYAVINRLSQTETVPIGQRIDSVTLDSTIAGSLEEAGIDLEYVFGVAATPDDSIWLSSNLDLLPELSGSDLRTRLFPHDVFAARNDLILFFPDREIYLWQAVAPMLVLTAFFVLIIVICFVYTIRTIIAQRRNAGLMVDFVNNMTHEFKTPISTVALACEAILRPDVISDREKVTRFSEMIQSENSRMRSQTEKILQMAALSEGDFDLKLTEVGMHEVIEQAIGNIALQIEHKHGKITRELEAANSHLMADKVHLASMIHNLLDNANKYSPEAPEVTILSRNEDDGIVVTVEDRGVGIREEDLSRVFEKYYRVPSGNVHNVKGFGLGLSYVKMMAEAHGGNVSLRSRRGKGTTVELFLPHDPARRNRR